MTNNAIPRLGWVFEAEHARLGRGKGCPIVVGKTLFDNRGLYAGECVLDALYCNSRPVRFLHRVRIGGHTIRLERGWATAARASLWSFDCTDSLYSFARQCALHAISTSKWPAPSVVTEYLTTGQKSLRKAASAATRQGAQREGAYNADWASAQEATRAVTQGDTWSSARRAALYAAEAALCVAGWAASRAVTGKETWAAAWGAAWCAASTAARNAARAAQNEMLTGLVLAAATEHGLLTKEENDG